MSGNILFPLNLLKEKNFDLYEKQASKYIGREDIMNERLPILNCLWNDVLHFSAVHPSLIKQALIEAGDTESVHLECFEIEPSVLDSEKTIVFLYEHDTREGKLREDDFAKYNPEDIAKYSKMPQETKEYYKEMYALGREPLLFHKIPHILFKGELDVSSFNKILV